MDPVANLRNAADELEALRKEVARVEEQRLLERAQHETEVAELRARMSEAEAVAAAALEDERLRASEEIVRRDNLLREAQARVEELVVIGTATEVELEGVKEEAKRAEEARRMVEASTEEGVRRTTEIADAERARLREEIERKDISFRVAQEASERELARANARLLEVEAEVGQLRDELALQREHAASVAALEEQLREAESRIRQLSDADSRAMAAEQAALQGQEELPRLRDQVERAREGLKEATEARVDLEVRLNDAQRALAQRERDVEQFQGQLRTMQQEASEIASETGRQVAFERQERARAEAELAEERERRRQVENHLLRERNAREAADTALQDEREAHERTRNIISGRIVA